MKRIMLNVNGVDRWVVAEKTATLADVLREQMLLTGCKVCCEDGQCGSCTVIDQRQARSLLHNCRWRRCRPTPRSSRSKASERRGTCIRCRSPGWRMAARSAASARRASSCRRRRCSTAICRRPARQVRAWFNRNRNLCRCTGYKPLVDAVMDAAAMLRGEKTADQVLGKAKENGSILGTRYHRPSALAKVTGNVGLRRRHRPAHAARHAASGADAGEGAARPHQGYRHQRSREDAGRREGHHLEGREGQERHHRPHHLPDQQGRRLGPADPVQGEGVPVRRRDRDRRGRHGRARPRGGRQGQGRPRSAAGLHVGLRRSRARRDRDPSRRAERLL